MIPVQNNTTIIALEVGSTNYNEVFSDKPRYNIGIGWNVEYRKVIVRQVYKVNDINVLAEVEFCD